MEGKLRDSPLKSYCIVTGSCGAEHICLVEGVSISNWKNNQLLIDSEKGLISHPNFIKFFQKDVPLNSTRNGDEK